jgi:hypothetical protein
MRKLRLMIFLFLLLTIPAGCQVNVGLGIWFGGAQPKRGISLNLRLNDKIVLEPIFSFGLGQDQDEWRWGLRCKYDLGSQGEQRRYLGLGIGAIQSSDLWETRQELGLNAFVEVSNPGAQFTTAVDLGPSLARIRYLSNDEEDASVEEYYSGGMKFGFGYHYNFHQEP